MSSISRIRVVLSGSAVVGPSVATFYATPIDATTLAAIRAFYAAIASAMPTGLNVQVPNTGDQIESTDGTLIGSWTAGAVPAVVTGTGTGQWADGVGARVQWGTGGIHHGRRVKGSTFLVPLVSAAFEGGGGLVAATRNQLQAAAAALVTATGNMVIWSKPGALNDGQESVVTSAFVPDAVSWLRSRRT